METIFATAIIGGFVVLFGVLLRKAKDLREERERAFTELAAKYSGQSLTDGGSNDITVAGSFSNGVPWRLVYYSDSASDSPTPDYRLILPTFASNELKLYVADYEWLQRFRKPGAKRVIKGVLSLMPLPVSADAMLRNLDWLEEDIQSIEFSFGSLGVWARDSGWAVKIGGKHIATVLEQLALLEPRAVKSLTIQQNDEGIVVKLPGACLGCECLESLVQLGASIAA